MNNTITLTASINLTDDGDYTINPSDYNNLENTRNTPSPINFTLSSGDIKNGFIKVNIVNLNFSYKITPTQGVIDATT